MDIDKNNLPRHIAIILDGNGRWAKQRGLPRTEGHRVGIEVIRKVIKEAQNLGIKVLSFFAFSTENWNRPKKEIDMLMRALNNFLKREINDLNKKNIKLIISGRLEDLPDYLQENLGEAVNKTKDNDGMTVNLCLSYGGRYDIVNAAKKIIDDAISNKIDKNKITEELFSEYLSTKGLPDPDLLIRTSGEMRISNFLLWQLSYTELYFPKIYWPDFGKKDLILAIEEYQSRDRRFGSLDR